VLVLLDPALRVLPDLVLLREACPLRDDARLDATRLE
jgi:hypothetical protein